MSSDAGQASRDCNYDKGGASALIAVNKQRSCSEYRDLMSQLTSARWVSLKFVMAGNIRHARNEYAAGEEFFFINLIFPDRMRAIYKTGPPLFEFIEKCDCSVIGREIRYVRAPIIIVIKIERLLDGSQDSILT